MPAVSCSRCGAVNEGTGRFCGRCGAPLAAPTTTLAATPVTTERTVTCASCGMANVPGGRFCGRCGGPLDASSTSAPPMPSPQAAVWVCSRCGLQNEAEARFCGRCGLAANTVVAPGAAVRAAAFSHASQAQVQAGLPRKGGRGIPWAVLVAVVGVLMAVLAVVSQQIMPHAAATCGVNCQPPPPPQPPAPLGPSGPPLPAAQIFTSSAFGYTVEYPQNVTPSSTDAQSITWSGTLSGDGSTFSFGFQGEAASGRTPQQIVEAMQQSKMSGATTIFTIGGAELGYTNGYGNVYEVTVSPQGGQQQRIRVVIEAAVQGDTAVKMWAMTPFTPDKNSHPSPAQMEPAVEQMIDTLGNTVTWKGEAQL